MPLRVLIAEDDASILASLEFLMQRGGFDARVARDGREALAALDDFAPQLVILDVMLPHASGVQVCRAIRGRAEWRDIRVLMLTARGGGATAAALAAGADDCMAKPFATRELVRRVATLLGLEAPAPGPR